MSDLKKYRCPICNQDASCIVNSDRGEICFECYIEGTRDDEVKELNFEEGR